MQERLTTEVAINTQLCLHIAQCSTPKEEVIAALVGQQKLLIGVGLQENGLESKLAAKY